MPSVAKMNIKYGNAVLGSPSSMRWSDIKQHTVMLFPSSQGVPNQFTLILSSFKNLFLCVPLHYLQALWSCLAERGSREK